MSGTSPALLSGTYGLRVNITSNTAEYVQDDSPVAETRYRARFRFDPNSITMNSGNAHYLLFGLAGASTKVLRLQLRCNGGACPSGGGSYQVAASLVNTGTTWTATSWFTLTDAPHKLELDWQRGASGSLTLWVDGTQQGQVTGINNSTRVIDRVRLGPVNGLVNGTRGVYYLDDFESRRFTYIGTLRRGAAHLARLVVPVTPTAPLTTMLAAVSSVSTWVSSPAASRRWRRAAWSLATRCFRVIGGRATRARRPRA